MELPYVYLNVLQWSNPSAKFIGACSKEYDLEQEKSQVRIHSQAEQLRLHIKKKIKKKKKLKIKINKKLDLE